MQHLPKIVRERLQAGVSLANDSLANHPDANVLVAFTEKALPHLERDIVLEHLARCDDCRDVVALALPEAEVMQAGVSPSPSRWLTWPVLRWGFATAGVLAIASIGVLQHQRTARREMVAKLSPRSETAATYNRPQEPSSLPQNAMRDKNDRNGAASAAAPASSQPGTTASGEPTEMARRDAPPAAVHQLPVVNGMVSPAFHGSASRGGPAVAGQQLAQEQRQRQLPLGAEKQQATDMASNLRMSPAPQAAPQTLDASAAASSATGVEIQGEENDYASGAVGKAKPPSAEVAANNGPDQPSVRRLNVRTMPGQIGGLVVDPTGAVLPNARITITPSNPGATTTAVTNSQGVWTVPGLPSGDYKAEAQAQGFKELAFNFSYDAKQPAMYSLTLSPGSVSETVEVASAQPTVQTDSAAVGNVVGGSQVQQLPIQGRNVMQLASLAPGTAAQTNARWNITPAGTLQRSSDQGATWADVDVTANAAGASSLALAAKAYTAKTTEAKKAAAQPAATPVFRAVAANGADVWAGGSGGALYHSFDAGDHWTRVVPYAAGVALTGDIVSLEFSDAQHGRVSTSSSEVWTTANDGTTWQKQ